MAPSYTDYLTLFGPTPAPANSLERVNKAINAWGCSVIHIKKDNTGRWVVVLDSAYNRRITAALEDLQDSNMLRAAGRVARGRAGPWDGAVLHGGAL